MTAIHVHLHGGALAQEFASYLRLLDFPVDLFVTYSDERIRPQLALMFGRRALPRLGTIQMIATPNRGRDIAPWLHISGIMSEGYELCCHIHSKRSAHLAHGLGDRWRKYLLDNLISPISVSSIFAHFADNPATGCVFPAIFPPLREGASPASSLYGSVSQQGIMKDLLRRMRMDAVLPRRELFFSAGSMFWYRPEALQPLFACGLDFDDFPEEPIPLDGTVAHAIERLIPIVCRRSGFKSRSITSYPYE